MMIELKPCPFCGAKLDSTVLLSEQLVFAHYIESQGTKWGAVQCSCGARGPEVRTGYDHVHQWAPDAAEAWNRRDDKAQHD